MSFRLYSYSTGEPVDMVEMHVLAKAYRAAWRVVHAREPEQCHLLAGVDLVIDFSDTGAIVPGRAAVDAEVGGGRRAQGSDG